MAGGGEVPADDVGEDPCGCPDATAGMAASSGTLAAMRFCPAFRAPSPGGVLVRQWFARFSHLAAQPLTTATPWKTCWSGSERLSERSPPSWRWVHANSSTPVSGAACINPVLPKDPVKTTSHFLTPLCPRATFCLSGPQLHLAHAPPGIDRVGVVDGVTLGRLYRADAVEGEPRRTQGAKAGAESRQNEEPSEGAQGHCPDRPAPFASRQGAVASPVLRAAVHTSARVDGPRTFSERTLGCPRSSAAVRAVCCQRTVSAEQR